MILLSAFQLAFSFTLAQAAFDHDHKAFDQVLKAVVKVKGAATQVDYVAVKQSPQFPGYLATLSAVKRSEYDQWSVDNRMAFLINAYNAFTLKLVSDHYPVKSIKKIGGFFSSPWKMKFFKLFGEEFNLDRIEHDMLRKDFNEPRVHFAVNCASIGCPQLAPQAYVGSLLNKQLTQQAEIFLRDSSRNTYDPTNQTLSISKIFDWFAKDFKPNVPQFVGQFMIEKPTATPEKIKVKYLDYNWGLNGLDP